MKKHLLALGTLLTTLGLLGCSGTPENPGQLGSSQQGNSLEARELSATNSSRIPPATNAKTVRIGSIDWYVNYDEALADARRTNRPVWLHFGENPG